MKVATKRLVLAGISVCLIAGTQKVASADEPVVIVPDGYGGLEQTVSVSGLQSADAIVARENGTLAVPYSGQWRFGCHIASPELIINHDAGPAQFIPEMDASWFGYFVPGSLESTWVAVLRATRVRQGFAPVVVERPLTAADLVLTPYASTDSGMLYQGKKFNHRAAVDPISLRIDVDRGDRLLLELCHYGPATTFSVRGFFLHSYPRGAF